MDVPINMCGVEENEQNYQTYLISSIAVMVFDSHEILFFRVVIRISISRMIFMLKYAFTHLFTAHTSLCCGNV